MYQYTLFLLFFAGIACAKFNSADYNNEYLLTPLDYTVYWNVDLAANELHLALKVKTTGWVCLLLSTLIYYRNHKKHFFFIFCEVLPIFF
jgi:hypothetical protein